MLRGVDLAGEMEMKKLRGDGRRTAGARESECWTRVRLRLAGYLQQGPSLPSPGPTCPTTGPGVEIHLDICQFRVVWSRASSKGTTLLQIIL